MSRITEGKGGDGSGGGGGGEVVESAPTMGEMHKCDPTGKKWTRRYFVLDGASLSYYSSQYAFEGGKKPRGVLDLKRAAVILGPGANARRMPTPYVFAVMTDLPKTRYVCWTHHSIPFIHPLEPHIHLCTPVMHVYASYTHHTYT